MTQFRGSLVEVRCAVTCATVFAELCQDLHPEHAEAMTRFRTRMQYSCRKLGDSIYKKELLDGHDEIDTP